MQLLSANVGQVREITYQDRQVPTAIWKSAVAASVHVGKLGLAGDAQGNTKNHGGIEQAVYVYDQSNYDHWSAELKREDFVFGQFGENFTVTGLPDDAVCIGDTLQIGTVKAQVSQPRTPCFKLGVRMDNASFVKTFTQSCRVGYYLRILEEGDVSAGDTIERIEQTTPRMSVSEVFRIMHLDHADLQGAARAAQLPGLSPEWRGKFEQRAAG